MPAVIIFGAGGLGAAVLDILRQAGRDVAGFLDSDPRKTGLRIDGVEVLGGFEQLTSLRWRGLDQVIVAVGENHHRHRLAQRLRDAGMTLTSAVHPLAHIAPSARLGTHLIVAARAIVGVHARIEDHCVIGPAAIVEHDNHIRTAAHLHAAVRLAGGVRIAEQATLGIGACVIPYRSIGRNARVEPGAVVIRDVPDGVTVAGVPARPLEPIPLSPPD